MEQHETKYDTNGNRICRVKISGHRGFSIQTNGNMPKTHRDGVGPWTPGEVSNYVKQYGTKHQKDLLGW